MTSAGQSWIFRFYLILVVFLYTRVTLNQNQNCYSMAVLGHTMHRPLRMRASGGPPPSDNDVIYLHEAVSRPAALRSRLFAPCGGHREH